MAFEKKYYGFGASVSMLIVVICFALTLILLRMFDFDEMMKSPRIDF
jgi:inositol-phosphate transport system permease protein